MRLGVYGGLVALALGATDDAVPSTASPAVASLAPTFVKTPDGALAVAVRFSMLPNWHIYWSNPGDSGGPVRVSLTLPEGWKAGSLRFPRPEILGTAEERAYGYQTMAEFLVPIVAHPSPLPAQVEVSAVIDWMVCKEACFLGHRELKAPVATTPALAPLPVLPSRAWATALPSGAKATIEGTGASRTLVVSIPRSASADPMTFVPDGNPGVAFDQGTGPFVPESTSATHMWRIPFTLQAEQALDGIPRIRGLVLSGSNSTDPAYQIDMALSVVPREPVKSAP